MTQPFWLAETSIEHAGLLGVLALLSITVIVMLWMFARLRRALRQLLIGARRFAHGDLSRRVQVHGPLNVDLVADSLNQMASQLEERLEAVIDQRNEFSAVVSNMIEGVITLDRQERIASMNPAAGKLLGVSISDALGRTIQEVVRNPALHRMVQHVLTSGNRINGEVEFRVADEHGPKPRHFDVNVTTLQRGSQRTGALMVMHDITTIHQLETVRRDFVANVSHELKTPVAAIKAAAETLRDLEPDEIDAAERFLTIVSRHADRLEAIIEDLLTLAKLEQHGDAAAVPFEQRPISRVLRSAVELCHPKAEAKGMSVQLLCDDRLQASIHAPMLEQAVVNLLDNAVKYSPEHSDVVLSAKQENGEIVIAVQDQGPGIEARDQHRLFERFYRADRARSRALGGTGLGLAIVKHIAQMHNGRVGVQSKPGEGSTFYISLPASDRLSPAPANPAVA